MPTLSAFADEVSQEPKGQIEALQANGIGYVELRGALGLNVMKFSKEQAADVRRQFADGGIGVSCIASPIGKVKLDEDWHKCLDDYKRAVDLAEFFGARYIRIFSYYPPEGRDVGDFRGEVISRLLQQVDYIADRDVTLVLENESNLFGAFPERCAYLHSAIPSEKLVMAFDPANFVNMNVRNVYETCWLPLRRYVGYFHIKDFKYGEKDHAVPAGTGDGNIPEMLRDAADDGYDGFLALEPHLGKAEHSTGQTGPELFKVAADALKKICADVGWRV